MSNLIVSFPLSLPLHHLLWAVYNPYGVAVGSRDVKWGAEVL